MTPIAMLLLMIIADVNPTTGAPQLELIPESVGYEEFMFSTIEDCMDMAYENNSQVTDPDIGTVFAFCVPLIEGYGNQHESSN